MNEMLRKLQLIQYKQILLIQVPPITRKAMLDINQSNLHNKEYSVLF